MKSNYGEMKTDIDLEKNGGYQRVSNFRVTSLKDKGHHGIDGIYRNMNPPPDFIIVDSKYLGAEKAANEAFAPAMSKVKSGRQMDSKWIDKNLADSIDDDVTKKKVESSVEDIKLSRFSEMEESEILKIVEMHRKKAPIKIPESANVKAKSMNEGYEQISYKWNDGIYKYEVRWHTRTPGAPKDQGNTWVIQRTKPGNGGQKPSTQFLIGDNEWVEGWKWYDAIKARKEGTATKEQIEILDRGHWKE